MVKKSIIAIALIGMLATVSFAQDGQATGQFKVDGKWPVTCTYTPVSICTIPIVLEVGMFIEIENCGSRKIVLKQVQCPAGQTPNQTFPCYKGCTEIKARSNFEASLTLKLNKVGTIINGNNWKAYFADDSNGANPHTPQIVPGNGNTQTFWVCVEAWDVNIFNGTPGTQNPVGEVVIQAVPTAAIVCN